MKKKESQWEVESAMEVLAELREALLVNGAPLSPEERKRFAAARFGFERYAELLEQAIEEADLKIPGRDLDAMRAQLDVSQKLLVLRTKMALALESVDDQMLSQRGEAYKTFLAYYRALHALAPEMPEVAATIEPIVTFFTPPKRAKAGEEQAAPEPAKTVANDDDEKDVDDNGIDDSDVDDKDVPAKVPA